MARTTVFVALVRIDAGAVALDVVVDTDAFPVDTIAVFAADMAAAATVVVVGLEVHAVAVAQGVAVIAMARALAAVAVRRAFVLTGAAIVVVVDEG